MRFLPPAAPAGSSTVTRYSSCAREARTTEDSYIRVEARKLRVIVLNGEWNAVSEPNASARSSGVTLLDDYIRANFSEVARVGDASLWQRR